MRTSLQPTCLPATSPVFHTLYDPTTQTVDSTGPFTENHSRRGKPAKTLFLPARSILSQPRSPSTIRLRTWRGSGFTNNFHYNVPSSNPFTKYFGRLDWQINQNNHIIISETNSDNPAQYHNQGICPVNCQNGDVSRDNAQISWVWTSAPARSTKHVWASRIS